MRVEDDANFQGKFNILGLAADVFPASRAVLYLHVESNAQVVKYATLAPIHRLCVTGESHNATIEGNPLKTNIADYALLGASNSRRIPYPTGPPDPPRES